MASLTEQVFPQASIADNELAAFAPTMRATAEAFGAACGHPVRLVPASTKGGYDEIYYALRAADGDTRGRPTERFAVVRINSPFKVVDDPIHPYDPGVPLDARGRLEREWNAYHALGPARLSPAGLWRSDTAIACSWLPADRVSRYLVQHRERVWDIADAAFALVHQMHALDVVHLDLNTGNLLIEPDTRRFACDRLRVWPLRLGPARSAACL